MADTFDSRLKLRLQESGANSGQWGTLLNQTITNIASVFGFGTHQLTSDADATLTLSDDGASLDALKSSYLKITSSVSLTATRTLTFAPNTLNQVKYIENATSGSQSITISQGSGANVTIESGATKVVYFDGAGSGAAVVDALANIDQGTAEFDTIRVSTIKANDGTASSTIADSTGVMTIASAVLTTADINGGTIDNTVIGGSTPAAGSFTTGSFSGDASFADNAKAIFGAGSDLQIYHDGSDSYVKDNGDGDLIIQAYDDIKFQQSTDNANLVTINTGGNVTIHSGNLDVTGSVTANGGVSIDNITIDGTEIDLSSGSLTLDIAGNIKLDADDNGEVRFLDGGTQYATIKKDGNNALFQSIVADSDFLIQGIDGSSFVTAASFDMSEGGAATFRKITMDGIAGTSPIFEMINNDNEDTDTGRETSLRFSGHRSGGEDVINAQISGHHDGSADDDKGLMIFFTNGGSGLTERVRIDSAGSTIFSGNVKASDIIASGSGGLSLQTDDGVKRIIIADSGAVSIPGSLSKGSGSFKIDHPLPSKTDSHHLVHSFVEAPQADNIYRGSVDLVGGSATVNIDTAAGMTDGTFVLLNTNVQCFTSNESGWTAIKGSVSGNTLTITAQDNSCTDTISWMVVGERHDQHMKDTEWTDSDGKVVVEPEKT